MSIITGQNYYKPIKKLLSHQTNNSLTLFEQSNISLLKNIRKVKNINMKSSFLAFDKAIKLCI
jgi:hypothetical protein